MSVVVPRNLVVHVTLVASEQRAVLAALADGDLRLAAIYAARMEERATTARTEIERLRDGKETA